MEIKVTVDFSDRVIEVLSKLGAGISQTATQPTPQASAQATTAAEAPKKPTKTALKPVPAEAPESPAPATSEPEQPATAPAPAIAPAAKPSEQSLLEQARVLMAEKITANKRAEVVKALTDAAGVGENGKPAAQNLTQLAALGLDRVQAFYETLKTL